MQLGTKLRYRVAVYQQRPGHEYYSNDETKVQVGDGFGMNAERRLTAMAVLSQSPALFQIHLLFCDNVNTLGSFTAGLLRCGSSHPVASSLLMVQQRAKSRPARQGQPPSVA